MSELEDRIVDVRYASGNAADTARDAAVEVARTARDAGADLASTAREAGADVGRTVTQEARQVATAATDQAQQVGLDVRQRVRDEVGRQHRQAVDRVGAFAEELYTMAAQRPQTPAGDLVTSLAARSRTFAEYLDQHGPERVLHELQEFARRRPATFIVAAVAAGFVVGRLGKGLWQDQHESARS
jgi:hypothetical protein